MDDLLIRPLGCDGAYLLSASAIFRAPPPLHLTRGISEHPGEAEKLMLGDLKLGADRPAGTGNIDRAADLARFINHAAPDELTYFIPAHNGPPRTGRETVAAATDARKTLQPAVRT